MKYIFVIFLNLLFVKSFGQSLIGKWRLVKPGEKQDTSERSKKKRGDLTLYPDSTFNIQGDTAGQVTSNSGWHVGEGAKGTWSRTDSSRLMLFLEPKGDRLFLSYYIIKLTDGNLTLESTFDKKGDKRRYITYRRL